VLRHVGRIDEARVVLERFLAADDPGTDAIVHAQALAELGGVLTFAGVPEEAGALFDEALTTLEVEQAWPALAGALVDRAVYLVYRHRLQEGIGVLRQALVLAEQHDLPPVALRARFNLAAVSLEGDRLEETVEVVNEGLQRARERGDRIWERALLSQLVTPLVGLGRWDEAAAAAAVVLAGPVDLDASQSAAFLSQVAAGRGDDATLERCRSLAAGHRDSAYVDQRVSAAIVLARDALERGAAGEVLQLARGVLDEEMTAGEFRSEAYAMCIEAALTLGDDAAIAELEALVAPLPPARTTPLLRAGRARLAAEQAHRRGDADAADDFEREAIALLRSVGARPLLARALVERAGRRDDAAALAEARGIYADLGATRWLARIETASDLVA
jgi:tetratricopeptide (TPR) repeat protein